MAPPKLSMIPKEDHRKLVKAVVQLEKAGVPWDCVRIPLVTEVLAHELAQLNAMFVADLKEANGLVIELDAKLSHGFLGRVLEPATREVLAIAFAQLRHDLAAQAAYPLGARVVGEEFGADVKWPDGTPAWTVTSRGQLEAKLRTDAGLKPQQIALLLKYGAGGQAFRRGDGGDRRGAVGGVAPRADDPKRLQAVANRVGVQIQEWRRSGASRPSPPTARVIPALTQAAPRRRRKS